MLLRCCCCCGCGCDNRYGDRCCCGSRLYVDRCRRIGYGRNGTVACCCWWCSNSSSSSLLLLLNSIRCTTLSVSISRPVCVFCCCWIRSVVLLFPFRFSVLFLFFFLPSSYSIINGLYYYWYYYRRPYLIVIDLHHKTNNRDHPSRWFWRIDPSLYPVVPDLFLSLCVARVLLPPPPPPMTTPTSYSLSLMIVKSILNLIRTLSRGEHRIQVFRHYLIDWYYNVLREYKNEEKSTMHA